MHVQVTRRLRHAEPALGRSKPTPSRSTMNAAGWAVCEPVRARNSNANQRYADTSHVLGIGQQSSATSGEFSTNEDAPVYLKLSSFIRNESGVTAVVFAVVLPALVMAIGSTIDYVSLARSKSKLQAITDAAALASNNSKVTTSEQATRLATDFVKSQITDDLRLDGTPAIAVSLTDSGRTTRVVLTTNFRTRFMAVIKPLVPFQTSTTVKRGLDNTLELALVLDTTGSMAADNKMTMAEVCGQQPCRHSDERFRQPGLDGGRAVRPVRQCRNDVPECDVANTQ